MLWVCKAHFIIARQNNALPEFVERAFAVIRLCKSKTRPCRISLHLPGVGTCGGCHAWIKSHPADGRIDGWIEKAITINGMPSHQVFLRECERSGYDLGRVLP